jgi:hypothetical protein
VTTIILVIVGVLLAGAAALFVIFYGGEAYNQSDAKAEAARLVNEGVMIQAAVQTFRAQEDRMPGLNGTGVDSVALWDLACPNGNGDRYLNQIPKGTDKVAPTFDCSKRPTAASQVDSPWKIDYNYGIARSVVGSAYVDGKESSAFAVCRAARKQLSLSGDPLRCDAEGISNKEPCCIMSADDAAA